MAGKSAYDHKALHMAALVVLLDRAGGSLRYTEGEYQAVLAGHGGKTMMALHAEILRAADAAKPNEGRLTLVRRPPDNAESPS